MIKYGSNNIGKLYFGNNAISKAYLGSNLVFSSGSGPTPTVGTPYIRGGSDGSYIDTGITADGTTRIIVWARNVNPGCLELFGSRIEYAVSTFSFMAPTDADTGSFRLDYGDDVTFVNNCFDKMSGYHKYELNAGQFLIDDVLIHTSTATLSENNRSIHLFGTNKNGTHSNPALPIDVFACKIYKNGTLVRDFTPVNTPSVGFYDAVSQTLFTNAGSGSFTYGTFDQNAYIPLEYISCANNQWFDAGINGSYSLPLVMKYMPTNTTARWTGLIGIFSVTNSESCGFTLGTANSANYQLSFRLGPNTSDVLVKNVYIQTDREMVLVKNNNVATLYENQAQIGTNTKSGVSTTFTTTLTMTVGATRNTTTEFTDSKFEGRFYYIGFGTQRNFVPAKVSGVAGMYDTYNDVFYPSASGTAFVAGPEL